MLVDKYINMNCDIMAMYSKMAYRYRIYPDTKRQKCIDEKLLLAQRLYNMILEKAQKEYKKNRESRINKSTLNRYMKESISENKDFLKLYSQARQQVFIRLQKAFQNFFKRVKEKKKGERIKAGFPRFKSIDRYKSITYPQDNGSFAIEKERKTNMLRISRIGRMKIDLHRSIEGKIKTLTIKKEAGDYHATFTTVKEIEIPTIEDTTPVGIDMGLHSFAAMSDGTKIEKPKFVKKSAKRIARLQRTIARRNRRSKRREKAKLKLQKKWERTTNLSNDFMQKLSDKLVSSGYTSFAVEKLNIQNMVKNHNLAQSIHNASWNRFIQLLSYKAESAGMRVIKVNPKDTSRTCSNCGNMQDMPLGVMEYICNRCGMQKDRDINASINILNRARAGLARSNAQGESVRPIGAVLEELRTYPANNRGSLSL